MKKIALIGLVLMGVLLTCIVIAALIFPESDAKPEIRPVSEVVVVSPMPLIPTPTAAPKTSDLDRMLEIFKANGYVFEYTLFEGETNYDWWNSSNTLYCMLPTDELYPLTCTFDLDRGEGTEEGEVFGEMLVLLGVPTDVIDAMAENSPEAIYGDITDIVGEWLYLITFNDGLLTIAVGKF